jgi:hypothetical protein
MSNDVWWKNIDERIRNADPTAPAELAQKALPLLEQHLKVNNKTVRDHDQITDAAIETLMTYIKCPEKFNPAKRSLLGYLKMSAAADLKNEFSKEGRRRDHFAESVERPVELFNSDGKGIPGEPKAADDSDRIVEETISQLFTSDQDRQIAMLIVDRVRSTAKFVEILGIANKPMLEQRKAVKREKDRIKKVLQRQGGKHYGR